MQSACNAYIRITKLYLPLVSQCNITIYNQQKDICSYAQNIDGMPFRYLSYKADQITYPYISLVFLSMIS